MNSLHKLIHQRQHDVPCPPEAACEYVWYELECLRKNKLINPCLDNLEVKLSVLIQILSEYDDDLDATIATLRWQRQIVHKFYRNPSM